VAPVISAFVWISLVEAGESISEKILTVLCGRSCIPGVPYGIFHTLGRSLKGTTIAFFMKYPDFVRSDMDLPRLKQENPFPKKYIGTTQE
jgi:hypothetical protein